MNTKIPRKSATTRITPPIVGAMTGAMSRIADSESSLAAASRPEDRSETPATPTAAPLPAARPCRPRAASSAPTVGASTQSADVSTSSTVPPSTRRRRPTASETGPATSCPTARPTRKTVTVS